MSAEVMRSEILEQPALCEGLLRRERAGLAPLLKSLGAKPPKGIVLAARGSSDNAAIYGRYLLEQLTGIPVSLAAPSLVTLYGARPRYKDYLVIGVSQSGQGPDVNAVMALAKRQGAATLGITNDPRSGLAGASRHLVDLGAGPERAVAATKTFTTELAALALLGVLWRGDKALIRALDALPAQMQAVLAATEAPTRRTAGRLKTLSSCVVLGRGYQLGVAQEIGLKMKECAGVPALSYSVADFAHGPVSLAHRGFPVFYVSVPGALQSESLRSTKDFLERGARVFHMGIRDKGLASLKKSPKLDLSMLADADVEECLSPLLTILPGQWFAYYNALAKGLDPAKPRGLKKITKTK
ncbi:MAG TPA: SIS domain-containing protein [bacterium]|jgi:glucosamine--fructose-6-phosphate aminotransferase (isomerizing)|nr:SIS domain-containing protein [bacterium]